MSVRTLFRVVLATCVTIAFVLAAPAGAAEKNKACDLVTPAELEAVVGAAVTLTPQGKMEGGAICTGSSAKGRLLLRLAKSRPGAEDAAKAGIESARKMGFQGDVETFGPITCSTLLPPENLAAHGFNTTCTVTKDKSVAGVEFTAKTKADMIPIERLKPLAEKMAGRF